MEKIAKNITKTLARMSPEKQAAFIKDLVNQMTIIDAELKDINLSQNNLDARATKRPLSATQSRMVILFSGLIYGVAAGIVGATLGSGIAAGVTCGCYGLLFGIGISGLNKFLIQNKVISNFFANIKQSVISKNKSKVLSQRKIVATKLDAAKQTTEITR